uniref:Uncharacterized protein n=1 Tax=viral metagenome TaxID=1070528 RepID=A0A6M3L8X3_9ZZZZ
MSECKVSNGIKMNVGAISIIVLLAIQLVAFSFGYGMLTQQVGYNKELIKTYVSGQEKVGAKLDDLNIRITRIETLLRGQ